MCVAAVIYKPETKEHLKSMQDHNPHGAGVAWCHIDSAGHKSITWTKGLGYEDIFDLQESGALTYPYLLHFRWATHGPKVPELAHPFPMGPEAFFHDTAGEAQSVLIHNGVWRKYEDHIPSWLNKEVHPWLSDTQVAAYVAGLPGREKILDEVDWATAIMRVTQNIPQELEIVTRGRWMKHQDNWFSNLLWLPWQEQPGYQKWNEKQKEREVKKDSFYNSNSSNSHNWQGYTSGNQPKPQSKTPPVYYTSPYTDYDGDYTADSSYWDKDGENPNCALECGDEQDSPEARSYGSYYPGEGNEPTPPDSKAKSKGGPTYLKLVGETKPLFTKEELNPKKQVIKASSESMFVFNGKPVTFEEYQILKYGTISLSQLNGDDPSEEETREINDEELIDLILEERERSGVGDIVSEDPTTVNKAIAQMAKDAMKKVAW